MPFDSAQALVTTKDIITLGISVLALTLSVVSTIYSAWRQRREAERQFRQRITDITDTLINSVAKVTLMDYLPSDQRSSNHEYVRGTEIQRIAARVRQADYLITDDTARLLTDVDYLAIAQAFGLVGDSVQAERYWALTLEFSQRPFYSATNRRLYGFYLFSQGRPDDGRGQYERAIRDVTESQETRDDQKCVEVGWIYEDWMQSEARFQFPDRAQAMRDRAKAAYQKIGDEAQRQWRLANLERTLQLYSGQAPPEASAPGTTTLTPDAPLTSVDPTRAVPS